MSESFTSILKACSRSGNQSQVFALLRKIQDGFTVDASLYPIAIKALEKHGFLLHSRMIKAGVNGDKYARNAMLNAYGKYGTLENARQLFEEMPERKVPDFNAMISCYWNWGCKDEAKALFENIPEKKKNTVTWTAMVAGYARAGDLANARLHFDRTPAKNVVSWNAMITAYAQNERSKDAVCLFDEMVSAGVVPNETTCVAIISSCEDIGFAEQLAKKVMVEKGAGSNEYVGTALLDLYAKHGHIEKARVVFDELAGRRNTVTWNSMVSAYARAGDLVSARELFDRMPERDVISWNSIIAGYSQNGESSKAVGLFKEMIEEGRVAPDEVTMVSLISACGQLGALELGNWVVDFAEKNCIELSTSGYNSLIFMYSKCGSMEKASALFRRMKRRDAVSYNALITGFAAHGNALSALKLLREMNEEGIEPNRVSYIGVLTACSHAGMLERGRAVFESIEKPDVEHYACMVDLLGRVGKLEEAKELIDGMPMSPNAGIYGSLLNASRIHKRLDFGEFCARKLFELEPEDSSNYVLLSNMYASAGKWKEVDRIRETMKARGVTKETAMSWVEYGGKIQ